MSDRYGKFSPGITGPAQDAYPITPGPNILAQPTRAIWVGGAGDLTIAMEGYENSNNVVTLVGVGAGTLLPLRVKFVFANTTATSLVGLY